MKWCGLGWILIPILLCWSSIRPWAISSRTCFCWLIISTLFVSNRHVSWLRNTGISKMGQGRAQTLIGRNRAERKNLTRNQEGKNFNDWAIHLTIEIYSLWLCLTNTCTIFGKEHFSNLQAIILLGKDIPGALPFNLSAFGGHNRRCIFACVILHTPIYSVRQLKTRYKHLAMNTLSLYILAFSYRGKLWGRELCQVSQSDLG